jgi:hypothetical protein
MRNSALLPGSAGYLVLLLMDAPAGLLFVIWLVFGINLTGPG